MQKVENGDVKKLERSMKDLPVEGKLKYSFKMIIIAFIITLVVAIGGITIINTQLMNFYQKYYTNTKLQLEIRKDMQIIGKNVLWAITSEDEAMTAEKIDTANTYANNVAENIDAIKENFKDKELCASLEEAVEVLRSERKELMEMAAANDNENALAKFNSTYNDSTEKVQDILLTIGDKAEKQAAGAYTLSMILGALAEILMIINGVLVLLLCKRLQKAITKSINEPIQELETAAKKLKAGELDIAITYESKDEMGQLADNFRGACEQMKAVTVEMGELLNEMANGNFDVQSKGEEKYVGDFKLLIDSLNELNSQLNDSLTNINESADQVAIGAAQMSDSAQSIAEGATEQAGAVEELTATIEDVANSAVESANAANAAAEETQGTLKDARQSYEEMQQLTVAMESITETSKEIENIIHAIEDIAEQTNLLSLNASIEAARAGEAGKGFAVVADQIGKLATDSAKSAVMTRDLISKALEEIEKGNTITEHTSSTINNVLASIQQFAQAAFGAAKTSSEQAEALKQIEGGIEQISTVIQNNSAAAEESSAVSEELSAQSETLKEMVSRFKLKQ